MTEDEKYDAWIRSSRGQQLLDELLKAVGKEYDKARKKWLKLFLKRKLK